MDANTIAITVGANFADAMEGHRGDRSIKKVFAIGDLVGDSRLS